MHSSRINFGDSTSLSPTGLILPGHMRGTALPRGTAEPVQRDKKRLLTLDDMLTFDQATRDAAGAFLIGQLERLDPTLYEPLVAVTWPRDIDLREDVTISDDQASFINMTFASNGGVVPNGIAWGSKEGNAIPGVAIDLGKTVQPLHQWNLELKWTLRELANAERLGKPIDVQQYDVMKIKYQMDVDQVVYVGDTVFNFTGLCNSAAVTNTSNAAAVGTGSATTFSSKTADQILADVNTLLTSVWAASGWAVAPSELRLPPTQFGSLVTQKVSDAGNISILEYVSLNSISTRQNGRPLNIQPLKWLVGRGTSSTDRMMAYTRDYSRVRYPLTQLQRTMLEQRSVFQLVTYWGLLGQIEIPYPETIGYMDGI